MPPHPPRTVTVHNQIAFARYVMDVGQAIPQHTDEGDCCHVTICAKGRARIVGPNIDVTLAAGEHYDLSADQQTHSVEALEDGTIVFNVLKTIASDWE